MNRTTIRLMLPSYPVRVDFWRLLPSSPEQTGLPGVRPIEIPSTSSDEWGVLTRERKPPENRDYRSDRRDRCSCDM